MSVTEQRITEADLQKAEAGWAEVERLNREIHRRSSVVSIFPNEASCLRLISAVLVEQDEEWQVHGRMYLTIQEEGSPPLQS